MLNFTVGPVQTSENICSIAAEQVPYFRTAEFSEVMLDNERLITSISKAPENSRAVFLTCSGSGGMEASIINCLTKHDKALVINGGSFGERFVELLTLHNIPYSQIVLRPGKALTREDLVPYENCGYTSFQVGLGAKTEGSMTIAGTKGYAYVPAPWWKTDYFEIRFEDQNDNKKYFYPFVEYGLRYEIKEFVSLILSHFYQSSKLSKAENIMMAKVQESYINRHNLFEL